MVASRRLRLPESLKAWGESAFEDTLKRELEGLGPGVLPLAQATQTGYVDDENLSLTVIRADADPDAIRVRLGVFFHEILAGCSCGDDPAVEPVYGEFEVVIERRTAAARFSLLPGP